MKGTCKLFIRCRDVDSKEKFPLCPHGPTLFFHYGDEGDGFYGCAAFRDKSNCSFYLHAKQLTEKSLIKKYKQPLEVYRRLRDEIMHKSVGHYCLNCNIPMSTEDFKSHLNHKIIKNLSKKKLEDPTLFLPPLNNDKAEAQYFFDQKALKFFENCFIDLKITKIICMGAPRLHAYLRINCKFMHSFLLDLDHRFNYFFSDKAFAWYNMCNNHFFDKRQEIMFKKFLWDDNEDERVLIFTDPPFGCRTEPIADTIRQLVKLYNDVNDRPHHPLGVFWIFPYFSAHYIEKEMPEMEMIDYKVNYTNHETYTDNNDKARKLGSPVRVFTNVSLQKIHLPVEECYKYCVKCKRYTALENRHCDICEICPSKNGSTYKHCKLCGRCVKPNYVHCNNCRRCTQVEGHNCQEYQSKQKCWICLQIGHTEMRCETWQNIRKKMILVSQYDHCKNEITCLLCGMTGHNEQKCESRSKYINEVTFMGETAIKFKYEAA